MISFPRALARVSRTVLRRSVVEQEPKGEWPLLFCRSGPEGLTLEAHRGDVGVRYHLEGPQAVAVLAFRSSVLAEFEGRGDGFVEMESTGPGHAQARWVEAGVPRVLDVETVDPCDVVPLPAAPPRWSVQTESFKLALVEAANTAARESGRFALSRVQLRGNRGHVISTDGRQLLLFSGFKFPWKEDVLIPRLPALALRDLRDAGPIGISYTEDKIALRLGAWTFFLGIDKTSRYPDVQSVIPRPSSFTSRLHLESVDAGFLTKALNGLPGGDDEHTPITLDLGQQVVVRAGDQNKGPITELVLERSASDGKPVRLCCNRLILRRALAMGFRELHIGASTQPAAWRNGENVYLFLPLDAGAVLPPSPSAVRVRSVDSVEIDTADHQPEPSLESQSERRECPVPEHNGNGHASNGTSDHASAIDELIVETDELRRVLQDAAARAGRVSSALRQQRRQSRAVHAAVETLRGLKIGPG